MKAEKTLEYLRKIRLSFNRQLQGMASCIAISMKAISRKHSSSICPMNSVIPTSVVMISIIIQRKSSLRMSFDLL